MTESTANIAISEEPVPPPAADARVGASIWLDADSAIDIHLLADLDGTYRRSVLQLGRPAWSGAVIYAKREDLVRLLVKLSEHLDELDRLDAADRKVAAAAETSK